MSNYSGQLDPLDATAPAVGNLAEAEAQAQATHRARRLRQIKLSIVSSLAIRPLSFVIPIITIRLFVDYLGVERYGLYETVGAIALYMSMANVGLTLGLINQLTECDTRDDRAQAQRYTSTLTWAMVIFSVVSAAVLTILAAVVNWADLLDVTSPVARAETSWAFWTAGLCVVGGLLAGIAPAIYMAYQETHLNNVWDGISKVLSLAACFAILLTDWGVVGVILVLSGVPVSVRLVNLIYLYLREKPWLLPRPDLFDLKLLRTMATHGVLLFALQMSVLLLFQTDKLIIGVVLGAAEVTGYAIVGRVFLTAYGVYMMLLTPLWPASGEALRRGDVAWVRKGLRLAIVLGCGMILLCGIAMLVAGDQILRLLSGGADLQVSRWLIIGVTLTFISRAWSDGRSVVLNSANVLLPQVYFYGSQAVLTVILAIFMARHFGVVGVAWATPITALFTTAWGYPWLVRRYIHSRASTTAPAAVTGRGSGSRTSESAGEGKA